VHEFVFDDTNSQSFKYLFDLYKAAHDKVLPIYLKSLQEKPMGKSKMINLITEKFGDDDPTNPVLILPPPPTTDVLSYACTCATSPRA
jgi:hypothetical protein